MTDPNRDPIRELIQTVHQLRAPNGCAWDRAQTHQTLRPYLIEEAYEVLDVLDKISTPEDLKKDSVRLAFVEELGDLLMQVILHSEMTNEVGAFSIDDVAKNLNDKLIRRHPHVFGDVKAASEETAFQTWEKQKAKEKASNPEASIFDGLPKGLPSLQRASRMIEKAAKVGFVWKDLSGPLAKLEEELSELKEAIESKNTQNIESELGDLVFGICNLSYMMKLSAEDALRGTNQRFESRFRHVERRLKDMGKTPEQSTLEEMDALWDEAKKLERQK